jgi:hypothetical protein
MHACARVENRDRPDAEILHVMCGDESEGGVLRLSQSVTDPDPDPDEASTG